MKIDPGISDEPKILTHLHVYKNTSTTYHCKKAPCSEMLFLNVPKCEMIMDDEKIV